jgi:hypothetical protein
MKFENHLNSNYRRDISSISCRIRRFIRRFQAILRRFQAIRIFLIPIIRVNSSHSCKTFFPWFSGAALPDTLRQHWSPLDSTEQLPEKFRTWWNLFEPNRTYSHLKIFPVPLLEIPIIRVNWCPFV